MKTIADKLAKKFGATIERVSAGRWETLHIDAPAGYVWDCGGIHSLKAEWQAGDTKDKAAALADAAERMEQGVSPCDLEDCDYCGEAE